MRKLFVIVITLLAVLIIFSLNLVSAVSITKENQGNSGSIWTTRNDCGTEQQNVNQYDLGEDIYINGANFDEGDYDWDITGQPGGASCDSSIVVASGTETVNESGIFCFNAYTIANDDCGEYKATFGRNKHDNYHVIPEFGLFVGALTMLGAVTLFFIIRRK